MAKSTGGSVRQIHERTYGEERDKMVERTKADIEKIVDIQMDIIRKMLSENGIQLEYTKAAREFIARVGYDPMFGARPVKRVIQREVVNDLSKRILAGEVNRERPIKIDAEGDHLTFSN